MLKPPAASFPRPRLYLTDTGHTLSLTGRISRGKALVLLAILMICWYLFSAYIAQEPRYGFHQMKAIPFWEAAALFTAAILAALLVRLRSTSSPESALPLPYSRLFPLAVLAAAVSAVVFWLLRNGFINDDGLFNMVSLQAGMRIIHHDEMLSSLMVTRIWQSGIAGLRPEDSISLFSAVWGGVYVFIIVLLGGRTVGKRWPLFLIGCLSAGYVQVFAGDVEFYGMVASLIALYLLLCLEHIRGNISLVLPSMALALAICSHLLAGWLLPSLLFLFIRALRRGEKAGTAVSAAAFLLTTAFIFIIVSAQGLPYMRLHRATPWAAQTRTPLICSQPLRYTTMRGYSMFFSWFSPSGWLFL